MGHVRHILASVVLLAGANAAAACGAPVCVTDYDALRLSRTVHFDELASSPGPGRRIDGILHGEGVRFGERFLGQVQSGDGDHDRIEGEALPPLRVVAGAPGQSLGIRRLFSTNVLLGYGPRGYPRRDAIGEGAISVVFDNDQDAFGFRLFGGELGSARISFFRRDGFLISRMTLGPLGESGLGFRRAGAEADIAGFVIDNLDPEGIAIDDLIFDAMLQLG